MCGVVPCLSLLVGACNNSHWTHRFYQDLQDCLHPRNDPGVCVCVNYHCMGFPQGCRRLSLCFSGSNKNTPKPFTELYPLEKTLQFFHVARDDVAEFVSCGFLTVFQ